LTERATIYLVALCLVALALIGMATLHREHYRSRKLQMLDGRLAVLERIMMGEHDG
jgi:hypothetical protein